jgi:hypothetical protein
MKKIAILAVMILFVTPVQQIQAEEIKTMVIIDDYLNVDNLLIKNKVVQELCILEASKCNNGENFEIGVGSANRSNNTKKISHGTQMLQVANKINPNINFIFISTFETTDTGEELGIAESSISKSLEWVYKNKEAYNIVVVSGSFGIHDLDPKVGHCMSTSELPLAIANLKSINVASIFASGNDGDYKKINFPACLPDAIAVGSTNKSNKIEVYTNYSPDVDFFVLGTYKINNKTITGTSASTAGFSAFWAKNYTVDYNYTYSKIKLLRKKVTSEKMIVLSGNTKAKTFVLTTNKFVDILK